MMTWRKNDTKYGLNCSWWPSIIPLPFCNFAPFFKKFSGYFNNFIVSLIIIPIKSELRVFTTGVFAQ